MLTSVWHVQIALLIKTAKPVNAVIKGVVSQPHVEMMRIVVLNRRVQRAVVFHVSSVVTMTIVSFRVRYVSTTSVKYLADARMTMNVVPSKPAWREPVFLLLLLFASEMMIVQAGLSVSLVFVFPLKDVKEIMSVQAAKCVRMRSVFQPLKTVV